MIQVVIILVLLMGAGGAGGYIYVQKLQEDNRILVENNAKMEGAVEEQKATIEALARQAEDIKEANEDLREAHRKLSADKNNLAKKLGKFQIDVLAQNKPVLVERIVNRASDAVLRCFEIVLGSPLTEDEKVATKKSEPGFNRECPSIANPSYKAD